MPVALRAVPRQEWAQTAYEMEPSNSDIVRVESAEQILVP